jgi:hypothetical protein
MPRAPEAVQGANETVGYWFAALVPLILPEHLAGPTERLSVARREEREALLERVWFDLANAEADTAADGPRPGGMRRGFRSTSCPGWSRFAAATAGGARIAAAPCPTAHAPMRAIAPTPIAGARTGRGAGSTTGGTGHRGPPTPRLG